MSWICHQVSASKTHTTAVMIKNGHGLYEAKVSAVFDGVAETERGFEKTTCDATPDPVFLWALGKNFCQVLAWKVKYDQQNGLPQLH